MEASTKADPTYDFYIRVRLDGTPTALFRVSGRRGEFLQPDGVWVADPVVYPATQWDTDVDRITPEQAQFLIGKLSA